MELAASSSSSSSAASEALIQTLISRGWCFGDVEQVKAIIVVQSALHGGSCTADFVESELVNMDLRSLGGKSLPDGSLLLKSSYLQGPKVLQLSSVRDISRSSTADTSAGSNNRRLLRFFLTDGHSQITAIEYSHIPSIADDVVPGTKVRLGNKAPVHSGIVCLNPKVITVLGGVVPTLYEEWQMNKKYSGFDRSLIKASKEGDTGGPPPFEKLQIEAVWHQRPQGRSSQYSGSTSSSFGPTVPAGDENSKSTKTNGLHNSDSKADGVDNSAKLASNTERSEEKPSSSEARPKEVAEAVPVQNQAAAQKLLQKLNQPNWDDRRSRGGKHRGKGRGRQEELPVFTLEEWERRKAGGNLSVRDELAGVSQDEALAWQLQNQFDMEDHQVSAEIQRAPHNSDAENIRMRMFSFERDNAGSHDGTGFRGRGRGRGRGRTRGGGRGRGRF
ncbi:uncharacterized protein LOC131301634 [Rhododendron vialii]|uniref:uncharacterized protein LOC131301634 n=1 Tax=Rhododendron vialii TaxID=182163 RepID=UPI00265EBCC2|nr:uncharacterized protein LOC131301634 [Rhododendron vialii]